MRLGQDWKNTELSHMQRTITIYRLLTISSGIWVCLNRKQSGFVRMHVWVWIKDKTCK